MVSSQPLGCARAVGAGKPLVPDWRDAAAYEPLLQADRSLIAWEWLRRDPAYREAAERAARRIGDGVVHDRGEPPERWGLHRFERPNAAVPEARPIWCAAVHPLVLRIDAIPFQDEDSFDLVRFASVSTLHSGPDGREHLLISDGLRAIRIDALAGSLAAGPVELRYRIGGLSSAERPLLSLQRLLALWRRGRFCRSLHPREAKAWRWVLMLRAHDALEVGANQREIALELLSSSAARERWRVEEPSLRSQVQRLVRNARRTALGGSRGLLL